MRKSFSDDLNKAEEDVSKLLYEQQKKFDDRFDQMEAMINDKFVDVGGSIQKVQASFSAMTENYLKISKSVLKIESMDAKKKDPFDTNKCLKQGFLQATFNVDNVRSANVNSKAIYYAGANWWLNVGKTESGLYLDAYLCHKACSVNVSYDTNFTIRLLGSLENFESKGKTCLTNESTLWGWSSFFLWSKLVNFTNGFVDEKGGFQMEVEFSVTGSATTCAGLNPQFLTCGFVESDCTVLVKDRRFPVNKGLLSAYSNFFKTLFFGGFREKDQDEIEMKEVGAEEFLHLLKTIYPPPNDADVNPNNVGSLLHLADRYQVKAVSYRCSEYLKKCAISEVSLGQKFLHARDYHLSELLEHCIKECKTVDVVKKLRATKYYSLLDKDIKLRILDNIT